MENNLLEVWLILSVVLLVADIFSLTIAMFFGSLAALTVGGAIYFNVIAESSVESQLIVFCMAYFLWGVCLWKPLKNLRQKLGGQTEYQDIVGSEAVVAQDVTSNNAFKVKWSGTLMRARLSENQQELHLKSGDVVEVISVKGNMLTVVSK